MIELTVNKADASAANFETLTTGMVKAVHVHFMFSRHWDGLTKIAVFTNGETTIDVPESAWKDRICSIPHEVLALPWRTVKCGVYGIKDDKLVLPAVWVGIGRVKPGADPSGDPSADPSLPVWAEMGERVDGLSDSVDQLTDSVSGLDEKVNELEHRPSDGVYTYLIKNPYNPDKDQDILRVCFHGLDSLDGDPEIRLFHCIRRRNRKYHWSHPVNWNVQTEENHPRLGYGLIAKQPYANVSENPPYPDVPAWMPNNGFIETVFPIDEEALEQGYIDIPVYRWMVPMLKPVDDELEWQKCGLIGLQKAGGMAPLLFRFMLFRNGEPVGTTRNTFCFGVSRHHANPTPSARGCPYVDPEGQLISIYFYTSIR